MCGEHFRYYCPVCKKMLVRDFGATPVVNYKGMELYITLCIDCGTELAIQPIELGSSFDVHTRNDFFRNLVANTKTLVSSCSMEMDEDDIIEKVFDELSKKYEDGLLRANELEIKQIIQHEICKNLNPLAKGFVYAEIADKCEKAGCIFF